jgi:hypothetical protein
MRLDALSSEIILETQQKAQVLPIMIKAIEDALEGLTGDSQTTQPIIQLIPTLQGAVKAALGAGQTEGQSKVDVVASRLDELSELVKQSSAQNQEQIMTCMKDSLSSILGSLNGLKAEMESLKELGRNVSELVEGHEELKGLMHTLITGEHRLPTLAVILPVVSNSWKKKTFPMKCVCNQYRLYFLCDHTRQIAPSGPEGKGYLINVTKEWVEKAKPVLRVGLVLLRVALLASGMPLPVPDLCSVLDDAAITGKYLDAALELVESPPDGLADEFTMKKPLDYITQRDIKDVFGRGNEQPDQNACKIAYNEILAILGADEGYIKKTCGLRLVVWGGKTAWVLNNDATVESCLQKMKSAPQVTCAPCCTVC